ncbi:MAG: hypothetical protein HC822_02075 [Oscillochloris sp.]|nr:hypothetical protein [Oscillochloris sp.]
MRNATVRTLRPLLLSILLVFALGACGTQGPNAPGAVAEPAAPVESPEDRVKGFFTTFSEALNDPEIGEETRRAEWIDRLTAYSAPDQQTAARSEIETTLAEFGGFDIAELTGQTGLDVRMEIDFAITETRLAEENGDTAKVELLEGAISMKPVGADVEQLGEMAAMLTQEVPISEFFGEAGDESRFIDLQRVDGVWYLMDVFE